MNRKDKGVRVSDDAYEQIKWLAKDENRTMKAIIDLSVFNWLGSRYAKYIKSRKK